MGYIMGYIRQKLCDIFGKNYGIYWAKTMGYVMRYIGQKVRVTLGRTMGYIGQKLWDILWDI